MDLLIIDDSKNIRNSLSKLIRTINKDIVIHEANSLTEGFDRIEQVKPNLIILDFQLKDGSALDLLDKVKKKWLSKIVVLSNYSTPQHKSVCLKKGAKYYLDKSNDMESLIEVIEEFLM